MPRPTFEKVHNYRPRNINVYLQGPLYLTLKSISKEQKLSCSQIVRDALIYYFETGGKH